MRLRPYQKDQVIAIERELATRHSTLVVSATGTGKAFVAAISMEVHLRRGGRRCLFLAPREELLRQMYGTTLRAVPRLRSIDVGVERAEERAATGTPIVLASPQSLHADRLAVFPPDSFTRIIVDEAHLGGAGLAAILDHFAGAKRVGFTATPDRLDGRPLVPDPYESIAHVYELPDAIEAGYLSRLEFRQARIEGLDLSSVRAAGGDLHEGDLERELTKEGVLVEAALAINRICAGMKTLVFTNSVRHAQLLAEAIPDTRAAAMDGGASPRERRRVMDAFRSGEISVLCNCMLYTYGLDVPDLEAVVLARPTMSRALNSQMVGRVTRRAPGKEFGLVVDLVGNVGQHKLVTPAEALRGSGVSAARRPYEVLVDDEGLLSDTASEVDDLETEADWETARTLAEIDAESIAALAKRSSLDVRTVDPSLAIFGIDVPERRKEDRNATPAQIQALKRAGIEQAEFLSFDQAQALFDELESRRLAGICTLKQGRFLARKGLHPNCSFSDAEWAFTEIKKNRWRVPPHVVARPGLRYSGSSPLRVRRSGD